MKDSEKRRKKLLEQTRNMYPAIHPRYQNTYYSLYDESESVKSESFTMRTFICLLIFVLFTFMNANQTTILDIDSNEIVSEIKTDFNVNSLLKTLID